nr:zinc finger protein SHOOT GRAVITROPISM 5-like [Setaria viridis]
MASSCAPTAVPPPEEAPRQPSLQIDGAATKKRRLRGTPGQDAEVVALSPPALLAGWNRWHGCEACGRGFRRPSNNLLGREAGQAQAAAPAKSRRRRVFVCPEPDCPYHAPSRALADLPTLQKHFRRKHGRHGLWACGRGPVCADCNKAHLKTCGARTQLEGYVERQDTGGASWPPPAASGGGVVLGLATTTSTSQQQGQLHEIAASPSSDGLVVSSAMASPTAAAAATSVIAGLGASLAPPTPPARPGALNLELQLMPPVGSCAAVTRRAPPDRPFSATPRLDLSLGLGGALERDAASAAVRLMVEEAREQLLLAMAEKAAAEEAAADHMLYGGRRKFHAMAAALISEVGSYVPSIVLADAVVDYGQLNAADVLKQAIQGVDIVN